MMSRTVYAKTTESCNLNCQHCFTGGSRPPRTYWNVPKISDWIDRFTKHIPQTDHVHFELHGGEPFLADLDEIKEVVRVMRATNYPSMSIGATTNLTYKLKDDMLEFMVNGIDHIGTSWDPDIRFGNQKQYDLWRSNLAKLIATGREVVLNVSVSKGVTQMDQEELIRFLASTGCYRVLFDRITPNGNANDHLSIFPTNAEINQWYLDMHAATERLGARKWFINSALEDVYAKFENADSSCGTFCRDCEEKNITLNADGTIGGCPNSAPEEAFGHMDMTIAELFAAPKRIDVMAHERTRNDACFSCPVFAQCGSDCHRLAWEGDVCASPRQLMMTLAGIPTEPLTKPRRVFQIHAAA